MSHRRRWRTGALAGGLALWAGAAAAADTPEPPRRPEPLPYRLQAPLLRPVFLPVPGAPTTLRPGEVERTNTLAVAVFRESDTGRPASNSAVSLVGDTVAGIGRFRVGLQQAWEGRLAVEYGFELAGLRWGRSPKFDTGPDLHATYRGVRWLDLRQPEAGWVAPVLWSAAGFTWTSGAGVGVQVAAALPSGSRHRGTGTRTLGAALTALAGAPLAPGLFGDIALAVVSPGRPDGLGGGTVPIGTLWQGSLALSYAPHPQWIVTLQAILATNPFPTTGTHRLDEPIGEVVAAVRWRPWPDLAVGLLFGEDLTRLAPDFSVGLTLQYWLQGRPY